MAQDNFHRCDDCAERMQYVGTWPRTVAQPTTLVFKCFRCGTIRSFIGEAVSELPESVA